MKRNAWNEARVDDDDDDEKKEKERENVVMENGKGS